MPNWRYQYFRSCYGPNNYDDDDDNDYIHQKEAIGKKGKKRLLARSLRAAYHRVKQMVFTTPPSSQQPFSRYFRLQCWYWERDLIQLKHEDVVHVTHNSCCQDWGTWHQPSGDHVSLSELGSRFGSKTRNWLFLTLGCWETTWQAPPTSGAHVSLRGMPTDAPWWIHQRPDLCDPWLAHWHHIQHAC